MRPYRPVFSEETFFTYVRRSPFGGRLLQKQIDGMRIIMAQPWANDDECAYALATAFHETSSTMQPVRETLAPSDAKAVAILDKAYAAGRLPQVKAAYWRFDRSGRSWLGRGYVQLTHERNYTKLSLAAGVDLLGDPSKAMRPDVAAVILFAGMTKGLFTGEKLSDYFGNGKNNPVGARAIVNGSDKAKLISGYWHAFRDALEAARTVKDDVSPRLASADDIAPVKSGKVLAAAAALVSSGGLGVVKETVDSGAGFLGAVSSPWAFASLALIVIAIVIVAGLFASGRLVVTRGAS